MGASQIWFGLTGPDLVRVEIIGHAMLSLVLFHVEGPGLDPDRVVDNAVLDRISRDAVTQTGVPVLDRVLGAEHC